MNRMTSLRRQRGVTLVIGLIMLVLLTLVVTTAFTLSSTNLKAVGNMQLRDEAVAAANVAVERLVSTNFTSAPAATTYDVDIDQDGTNDYRVNVSKPVCVKAIGLTVLPATDPDAVKCTVGSGGVPICYETVWDITATVDPATGAAASTGTRATVKQGIKKRVNITNLSTCA